MRHLQHLRVWGIPVGRLWSASPGADADPDGRPDGPRDVVAEMPDPDAAPGWYAPPAQPPRMTGQSDADPDGPPVGAPPNAADPALVANQEDPRAAEADREALVERLDVPPERRPWDAAQAPERQRPPKPFVKPINVPHCNGRHGLMDGLTRCDYCDNQTEMASRLIALEREVAELRAQRRAS